MVGVAYDCLANPLGAVRSTFGKAIASGSDPASFSGKDWGAVDVFRSFLYDDGGLSQVPLLNSASIRWVQPNTLVRFRGMIQDMLGNEFYVGAYKDGSVWRTNKFTDVPQFPMDSKPDMRLWERRMIYCIPVSDDGIEGSPSPKKLKENGHSSLPTPSQQSITEGTSSSVIMVPDVDRDLLPCLIKIYDCPESDLKLNEVFEFVGVFTFDSEFKEDKDVSDDFTNGFSEDVLVHLPPNKVPRLHCFIHRKLAVHDFLPCSPTIEPKPNVVKEIRESFLRHLTAVLGNDGIAANFMLLHLMSMVYSRVETVAVGKLSLNLTCLSKESAPVFGTRIGRALKNLLPFTQCISVTVDYLNTASLAPRKDYETSRLITGALQLAEGSHMIFDETRLEAGILNSVGVENARLLKTLIELQKVEYDFKFYKLDMPADIQILVLSEGKSNILLADVVLPFHPSSVASVDITAEALEAWRWYLATLRSLPHSIEPEIQKLMSLSETLQVMENDLVEARQEDRTLGTQDFSRLLTMGRLMSMSFGETSLSLEHWQMVKELERLRRERLK
ncbi:mini-chromosome maintenance complex-binding protein-like isoform X3 [Malus sylvestris]|uniref:mini-chromosome maintenance complex-binding protein-like isoform X3 n=1 Tax=Malus sylvestris TaxID=3752 RepID=UPI0021AC3D91|nr:mini-chromosome maintenance complex-binding protein-like isoform X3 [Malus sylvestris]